MKTLMIIDTKLLAYWLFHRKTSPIKILDLLLDIFNKAQRKQYIDFGNIIPVFVMDKGKSKRAVLFPEYKAQRKELIKKQGTAYVNKVKAFEKLYQKMEGFYRIVGRTLSVSGLEADDLGSIVPTFVKDVNKVLYVTSDVDWIKFMDNDNSVMLHVDRKKFIKPSMFLDEFGYIDSKHKLFSDVFCGVRKENVPGLSRFGKKTFEKLYKEYKYNIVDIINVLESMKGKYKLPNNYKTVQELFDFNMKLFKPMSWNVLNDEEKETIKKQWSIKSTKDVNDIIEYSSFDLGEMYIPNENVKSFFKIS